MGNYLRLRFSNDGDGTGKLIARAEVEGFSGEGEAYFSIETLEEFADSLRAFPFPLRDARRSITGGFGSGKKPDEVAEEHLGISAYLANAHRGYIGIQVRMATAVWPGTRPESKKQAVVEILTTYEPLSKFGKDLTSVLRASLTEALLEGESLSSS
jgi:hypothetical protein